MNRFAQNNPYSSHPDPLNEAKSLLEEGRIKQAIFAYEAALTRLSDNDASKSDVWHDLGQAHAENENDAQALLAYDNALGVDPNNLKVRCSNFPPRALIVLKVINNNKHEILVTRSRLIYYTRASTCATLA